MGRILQDPTWLGLQASTVRLPCSLPIHAVFHPATNRRAIQQDQTASTLDILHGIFFALFFAMFRDRSGHGLRQMAAAGNSGRSLSHREARLAHVATLKPLELSGRKVLGPKPRHWRSCLWLCPLVAHASSRHIVLDHPLKQPKAQTPKTRCVLRPFGAGLVPALPRFAQDLRLLLPASRLARAADSLGR